MTLNLTADPERVKHLLITARDELKVRGWTQGRYGSCDGPKCTLGVLLWAETGEPLYRGEASNAHFDAGYTLTQAIGDNFVVSWNDEDGRTAEQVIAAFDSAIALVDAEIARRAAVAQVQEIAHLEAVSGE